MTAKTSIFVKMHDNSFFRAGYQENLKFHELLQSTFVLTILHLIPKSQLVPVRFAVQNLFILFCFTFGVIQ